MRRRRPPRRARGSRRNSSRRWKNSSKSTRRFSTGCARTRIARGTTARRGCRSGSRKSASARPRARRATRSSAPSECTCSTQIAPWRTFFSRSSPMRCETRIVRSRFGGTGVKGTSACFARASSFHGTFRGRRQRLSCFRVRNRAPAVLSFLTAEVARASPPLSPSLSLLRVDTCGSVLRSRRSRGMATPSVSLRRHSSAARPQSTRSSTRVSRRSRQSSREST